MKFNIPPLNTYLTLLFALGSVSMHSTAFAESDQQQSETVTFSWMSAADMKALDQVLRGNSVAGPTNSPQKNHHDIDQTGSNSQTSNDKFAMQIGLGGNPDVDNGKPFRSESWVISVLYPVKVTNVAGVPTTIYMEARCASLGKQPPSAYTENINVRCGPGVVADAKITSWISAYSRLGVVTSRFSRNGAPRGQINPSTGVEYRLYPNDTWFTGAAMGAGIKIKVLRDTQVFAEYTKYLVQQTDNPAYQFRGGFNAGIAKRFWLFQRPPNR